MKALFNKAKNLDLKAFKEGRDNYKNGRMKDVALERSKICSNCEHIKDEPIDFFAIKDDIESISGKMCGECGCTLPYLLRQNKKICRKW